MSLEIRLAQTTDSEGIADIITTVWDDDVSSERIAEVLILPEHSTHVAVNEHHIIGFVDGFMTLNAAGAARWELDLLAVHPDYRSQGIAKDLVRINTAVGLQRGAKSARGLVRVANLGAEKAFAHNTYRPLPLAQGLYLADGLDEVLAAPSALHLLHVQTMQYRGLWIEGQLSLQVFKYARFICNQQQLDVAGVVIPQSAAENIQDCLQAGFTHSGNYQSWMLNKP